jgi:hypothetical protein
MNEIRYRSMAGIVYRATLVKLVQASKRAMIEVDVGAKDPVVVTARWIEVDRGEAFTAWPEARREEIQGTVVV